ncbi:hypothetical protein ID852_18625 [Xenorhabdus sp. 42]|nr:hypothetical protein [Xenorhabdus sp. 42]
MLRVNSDFIPACDGLDAGTVAHIAGLVRQNNQRPLPWVFQCGHTGRNRIAFACQHRADFSKDAFATSFFLLPSP